MHGPPFDTITALHWVAWKLVDDITLIINNNCVRKFFPGETAVCQNNVAAGKGNTGWRIRALIRITSGKKQYGERNYIAARTQNQATCRASFADR